MKISRNQYKLLKKISKNNQINLKEVKDTEIDNFNYLADNNLLTITENSYKLYDTDACLIDAIYKVSPLGEAEMYEFKSTFYKWWIPVVISIEAFVVSTIALFK